MDRILNICAAVGIFHSIPICTCTLSIVYIISLYLDLCFQACMRQHTDVHIVVQHTDIKIPKRPLLRVQILSLIMWYNIELLFRLHLGRCDSGPNAKRSKAKYVAGYCCCLYSVVNACGLRNEIIIRRSICQCIKYIKPYPPTTQTECM